MDVTTVSGSPRPGAAEQMRRASEAMAASAPKPGATTREQPPPAFLGPAKPLPLTELPPPVRRIPPAEGDDPGVLKFELADADVLTKFAIHEQTHSVMVTMYQRDTGEVLREFPSRQVLDVMAALAGRGLAIDVSS